jgi:hypothetical protein
VLVVLDGDGAVFQDYLYANGRDGGAEAASLLQRDIKNQLNELYPDANVGDWQIIVNVVLNMQGLGTKLQACNIISNPNELSAFGRGKSTYLSLRVQIWMASDTRIHSIRSGRTSLQLHRRGQRQRTC